MRHAIDALRQIHNHPHVVLDDQQRHAKAAVDGPQARQHAVDKRRVDSGGGLVQQQHRGARHQCHGQFQKFLLAEGQFAGRQMALFAQSDKFQQFLRVRIRPRGRGVQPFAPSAAGVGLAGRKGDSHVVHAGHFAVDAGLLEGSDQPDAGDLRGGQRGDVASVKADFTGVGRMRSANQIEEGAFAGAVRADESDDFTRMHLQRDAVVRHNAAKALGHFARVQQWRAVCGGRGKGWVGGSHFAGACLGRKNPATPSGKKTTATTMRSPSMTYCHPRKWVQKNSLKN